MKAAIAEYTNLGWNLIPCKGKQPWDYDEQSFQGSPHDPAGRNAHGAYNSSVAAPTANRRET